MARVGVTMGETVIVAELDTALSGTAHDKDDMSTHLTTAPVVRLEVMKELLLVPEAAPFTLQLKTGLRPPFVILLVKVSGVPLHMVVCAAVIAIVGTTLPIVIVIALEVDVAGRGQVASEVMTQDTTCPLVSVVVV